MSGAPRLLLDLHQTLQLIHGDLLPNSVPFHQTELEQVSTSLFPTEPIARRCIISIASADKARDHARAPRLVKPVARDLCRKLCTSLDAGLVDLWKPVSAASIAWNPSQGDHDFDYSGGIVSLVEGRRVLLFHLAALMDINECELAFLVSGFITV
ncbi:hypothetical protein FGB62_92g12 [Gracilaria domingensis]|nr:hypothetical protein FGB62_92g12 [Gracilaria domingensis]